MKKIVFSVLAIVSLLAPMFMLSRNVSATTCPVKMPETLLSLYRNSDAIYVARYVGFESGDVTQDDDDYSVVEIKNSFDVTTVLKGKETKAVTLFDKKFEYKGRKAGFETIEEVERSQAMPETSGEDIEDLIDLGSKDLKPGDDVLLFLRNDEDSERLEMTDYRDGIKNLPISDIAIYEARIKELNTIFAAETPDAEKITDWLVRCAEDEATRWEGTYELESSFNALAYKTQRDAERQKTIDNGGTVENDYVYFDSGLETGRTIVFATLLNDYQKQTLANVLLNREFQATPKRPGQAGFVRGDSELMSLVSRWADTRIALVFMEQLRSGTYNTLENNELMSRVVTILDDERLTEIAEKYDSVDYEDDDDEVDAVDLDMDEDTSADEDAVVEPEKVNTDEVSPDEAEDIVIEDSDGVEAKGKTEKKPVMTYKQFRANLITKFLSRADEVVMNPEARKK